MRKYIIQELSSNYFLPEYKQYKKDLISSSREIPLIKKSIPGVVRCKHKRNCMSHFINYSLFSSNSPAPHNSLGRSHLGYLLLSDAITSNTFIVSKCGKSSAYNTLCQYFPGEKFQSFDNKLVGPSALWP